MTPIKNLPLEGRLVRLFLVVAAVLLSVLTGLRTGSAEQSQISPEGVDLGDVRIGDLADNRIVAGMTGSFAESFSGSLRGRYVSTRETVETNPVGSIEGFVTVDAVFTVANLLGSDLAISLKVDNIFDEGYFHPGVREANAGIEAGSIDEDGSWQGSVGFFNSMLAQPGRTIRILFRYGQ